MNMNELLTFATSPTTYDLVELNRAHEAFTQQAPVVLKGRGEDQKPVHVSRYDIRERKDVRRKYRDAKSIRKTETGWEVTP